MARNIFIRLRELAAGSEDWWDKMSREEQDNYLKEHPGSRLRETTHPAEHKNRHERRAEHPEHESKATPFKSIPAGLEPAPESREHWPEHIKKLRIPPAWQHVHISNDPDADLQAIGKDTKDRSQYVYSTKFRDSQTAIKFARIKELDEKFDSIKKQNAKDRKSDDPKTKDAADCTYLIMMMGIRPGSEEDTGAEKKAYGATTLQANHVTEIDGVLHLHFIGKKGVELKLPVKDKNVAAMLKDRAQKAGENGQLFPNVSEKSLLDYVHGLDGGGFKTKDFRTRLGTKLAQMQIDKMETPSNSTQYKKAVREVAKYVSQHLGNTPAIALTAYISPVVWSAWEAAKPQEKEAAQQEAASFHNDNKEKGQLPEAHFGQVGKTVDWRKQKDHDDHDDDEHHGVFKSVLKLIGFNPLHKDAK